MFDVPSEAPLSKARKAVEIETGGRGERTGENGKIEEEEEWEWRRKNICWERGVRSTSPASSSKNTQYCTTILAKQEDSPTTVMKEGSGIKNISVLLVALLALSSISAAADSVVGEVRVFHSRKKN